MKVYAQYTEVDGLALRCNTLLQFGDSWQLLGNIVLANPGSAKPVRSLCKDEQHQIAQFYRQYRPADREETSHWYRFSNDPTMGYIEKLFSGWYIGEPTVLSGVVQLFNTFNLIDPKLERAIAQINCHHRRASMLVSPTICEYFNDAKTYLGFGQGIVCHPFLGNVAKQLFDTVSPSVKQVYAPRFEDNPFYHPAFINRAYRQLRECPQVSSLLHAMTH